MSAQRNSALPAAVVLGGEVNGLGVVRSLARAGIPILLLDTDLTRPTMHTRFGKKLKAPSLSGPGLLAFLKSLRPTLASRPVLFATQEATVATLSDAYASVTQDYGLALPDNATVKMLLDKTGFQTFAEEQGFRVPKSRFLTHNSTARTFEELQFPCILKPTTKNELYAKSFAKAYRVNSAPEASALWERMQSVIDEAIIQEWIDGNDSDVYFCLQYRPASHGPVTSFCGRKTMQWPPLVGGTATCIPAPQLDKLLVNETSAFFERTKFVGVCSMEYKRNPSDGHFYMIEPTVGRTDYQEEIAALNGVNIPLAAYQDLSGTNPGQIHTKRSACAWRDSGGHHNATAAGARDPIGDLMPDAKIFDAYFRTGDPMPYLKTKFDALRARLLGPTNTKQASR